MMITLSRKLKEERNSPAHKKPVAESSRRVSVRDKLLVKEVPEMETNLPGERIHDKIHLPQLSVLHA